MQVKALFIRKKHSSPNIADSRRVVTRVPNSPAWWVMIHVQNSPSWWVMFSVQNPQRSRKQDSSVTRRTQGKTRENTRRTGTGNDTGKLQQRSDNTRRKTRRYIGWFMEYSWRWWENQVISGNAHLKQSVHTHTHTHKTRENWGLSNLDNYTANIYIIYFRYIYTYDICKVILLIKKQYRNENYFCLHLI